MLTTSVNCSPLAVDPSSKPSENGLERSFAVELAIGLYSLCPEQLAPHIVEGKKRSLLPVSICTVSCRGSDSDFESIIYEGHTSESHGRCANRDGAIPQHITEVSQWFAASGTSGKWTISRKGMSFASIPLVSGKSFLNFPVSDR